MKPVIDRSGDIINTVTINRKPQIPNLSCIFSIGLAPRVPVISKRSPIIKSNGIKHNKNTAGLT